MTPATNPPIRFGTDGWRAIIAEEFTFANVRVCAQAYADHLNASGAAGRGAVVGYDTRFGSDRFARAVATVLAANGVHVWLCDRAAPTPAVSLAVTRLKAAGGAVITASHNAPEWNGFKVKSELGASAPPEQVTALEDRIADVLRDERVVVTGSFDELRGDGSIEITEPIQPYIDRLVELVDISAIRSSSMRIVVDSMHGAGGGIFPRVLSGGALGTVELNGRPNPAFPGMSQPEPVEANLTRLMGAVPELGAAVGIAVDGDADRVGIVDENGRYFTTLEVFSLLAHHLLGRRGERGVVACTITMSGMIDKLGAQFGVPVIRTPVGFKYVGPAMVESDGLMGGEESGGYAFRGHIPERDGTLSGLLVLDAMVASGMSPSALLDELRAAVGPHAFKRLDLEFDSGRRGELESAIALSEPDELGGFRVEAIDRRDGVRFVLEGGWWAIARFSGTEPLVRLYAEAASAGEVERLLSALEHLLGV